MDLITDLFLSKVLIFAIAIVAAFLAYWVFKDNPKGEINKIYLLMTLLMICWVGFAYIPRVYGWENYSLGFVSLKIAWFMTPPFFSLLYLLTVYLIGKEKEYARLSKIVLGCGIILALIIGFSDWVIVDYQFIGKIVRVIYGPLMLPFLGVVAFIMAATVFPIVKDRDLLKDKRLQLFLVGLFAFYFLNVVFNIFLPIFFNISRFYFLGDYSTLILLGFTAYAIVQHRLFDVRILLTEAGVAIVMIILLTDTLTSETLSEWLVKGAMLILVSWGGYLLIKSVRKEIAQREQLQVLTQELEIANERLKKMDEMKDEFISIASHDLNTPIAAIEGYLSMILDEKIVPVEDPKAKEYLQRVYESSKRLAALVEDLLNVSRIEQGRLVVTHQPLDFQELVEQIVKEWEMKAKEQGLSLRFIPSPQALSKIYADPNRLSQVVTNLISNAIKYSSRGEIKISLKEEGGNIIFEVADQGVGISKKDLVHLFEKFYRVSSQPVKGVPGTGLGLYITKAIVELHGGTISVESEEGKGSTFRVTLPKATNEQLLKGKEKEGISPQSQKVAATERKIIERATRQNQPPTQIPNIENKI